MIENVRIGASVTMTPQEAYALVGKGEVRLVTCPNGRIMGGVGSVGLVEHTGETDLLRFAAEVNSKLAALQELAAAPNLDPRTNLFTFVRI